MSATTKPGDDSQILCDLHDLGFHGASLAHLEQLSAYILKRERAARIDEVKDCILILKNKCAGYTEKDPIKLLEKYVAQLKAEEKS